MKKKHEVINGQRISVWENKNCVDKYTVVFLDDQYPHNQATYVAYLAMSGRPFYPQGFCQRGEMNIDAVAYKGRGGCFNKRIKFADHLPADCQRAAFQDMGEA